MHITNFQGQPVVELQNGPSRALVSPAHGARLLRWSVGDWEVVRWPANADWSKPQKVRGGNPVLFPFIARSFHDNKIGFWKSPDGAVRPAPRPDGSNGPRPRCCARRNASSTSTSRAVVARSTCRCDRRARRSSSSRGRRCSRSGGLGSRDWPGDPRAAGHQ